MGCEQTRSRADEGRAALRVLQQRQRNLLDDWNFSNNVWRAGIESSPEMDEVGPSKRARIGSWLTPMSASMGSVGWARRHRWERRRHGVAAE